MRYLVIHVLAPGPYFTLRPVGGGLTIIFGAHELLSTGRCAAVHMEVERVRFRFRGSYDPALV